MKQLAVFIAIAWIAQTSFAACWRDVSGRMICPGANVQCVNTRTGELRCGRPNGGILLDNNGDARCGVGYCTYDNKNNVVCSTVEGGGAIRSLKGDTACDGSCTPASGTMCSMPRS